MSAPSVFYRLFKRGRTSSPRPGKRAVFEGLAAMSGKIAVLASLVVFWSGVFSLFRSLVI
jgi:hypothetical protein